MIIQLFFILIIEPYRVQSFAIPNPTDPTSIINFALATYESFTETPTASIDDVLEAVSSVTDSVNEMGNKISIKIDAAVHTLIKRLPLFQKIDSRFQKFWGYILRIDRLYQNMQAFLRDNNTMNDYTLNNFLEKLTSQNDDDLQMTVTKLYAMIVPFGVDISDALMGLIVTEAKDSINEICDTKESPQQRLYEIYSTVMLAEMKAYIATGFGYSMLTNRRKRRNFMGELCKYERELEIRIRQYASTVKDVMSSAPRTVRRCDPPKHIRNETFYEFERFQQQFIVQETALRHSRSCEPKCIDTFNPTLLNFGCEGYHCAEDENSCLGQASNCDTVTDDNYGGAEICESPYPSVRRFTWFKNGFTNKYVGNFHNECPGIVESLKMFYRTYRPEGWFADPETDPCDVCHCVCTEDHVRSQSFHFISLREQSATTSDNRIVIGLKFVMQNKILHLQIQEGILRGNGTIDPKTIEWKAIENIFYDREASISSGSFIFYKQNEDGTKTSLQENVDVAVLTFSRKTINLDDLETSEGTIVTGVRFKQVPHEVDEKEPIQLEIKETSFNYIKGELIDPDVQNTWINADDMKKKPGKLKWYQRDRIKHQTASNRNNPLVKGDTIKNSVPNSWLTIIHSSWALDGGQTVLPLIDALAVTNTGPIGAVNLFHKTQSNLDYGGFLSLEISTVDRSLYMIVPPSENSNEERQSCQQSDALSWINYEKDKTEEGTEKEEARKILKKVAIFLRYILQFIDNHMDDLDTDSS